MKKKEHKYVGISTVYRENGKGRIAFVHDRRFGDDHYVIYDKDDNCIERISIRCMNGNLHDILNFYVK